MFLNFSENLKKVLFSAQIEKKELKHDYIGTEHFILAILKNSNLKPAKIFNKYNVNYLNFKNKIIEVMSLGTSSNVLFIYTPLLRKIIEDSISFSEDNNYEQVEIEHLLCALFEESDGVAIRLLLAMGINVSNLGKEFVDNMKRKKNSNKEKYLVEDYGCCLNTRVKSGVIDPVIGRDSEISRIIEILCRRTKNNPLLVGPAGVGKTAIVEELSRRIVEGNVPDKLKNKKIFSVSMSSLVGGTKYRGEFEERINKILHEIENCDDIIIFIDEIHTLVGAGGAEGAIDASNILKPYLARGQIKIIGATTTEEYKKYFEDDRALDRRFQFVSVVEPSDEDVYSILSALKPMYEKFHGVIIQDDVIKNIVKLTNKYIYNRKQPDKSIDVLDEACSKVSITKTKICKQIDNEYKKLSQVLKEKKDALKNNDFQKAIIIKDKEKTLINNINILECKNKSLVNTKFVSNKIVANIIKSKTNIPVYEFLQEDVKRLNNISKSLKKTVVGQDKIIDEISNDIKFLKLGFKSDNKPTSYLFVGPTGVGKTLLAKELANTISSGNIVRLDMSEYKESHSVSKIIGSPPGYIGFSNKNTVLDEIKQNPNSVVLIDEIEKAHKDVINLFLQIFDEGCIKKSNNEIIRFDNNIIIMTSNIGFGSSSLGYENNKSSSILRDLNNFLGIEFTNRIDKIFLFRSLDEHDVNKIVHKKLEKTRNDFLISKDKFKISREVIKQVVNDSKYKEYGARKIDKLIKEKIQRKLIEYKIERTDKIFIETI